MNATKREFLETMLAFKVVKCVKMINQKPAVLWEGK
jgi:hypothetical protein